ncbi:MULTISPECIES: MerR family transcriptional regulator [Paenibacillus]|uniref:MerR family transcriptional regulator n=1 Tax=Paenibacillus TaxID=44249 RepID=UPI0004F61FF5|nr:MULTISPECIES: MerR family transcriptional regulator [unclassified Paenibacillus]AIQ32977.1 MerR family transcriptional regulator [Paenibacillus sp. FSL P4-0081]OMF28797.1 MerR family transcriptional regulator [Paenibacillus sp. FSL H8-0259]
MKYSIGEFASILGVTADTLRLYEKHDIVRPVKDQHNNYRYFNDLDARNLLSSRWYRSMQIPLQDVAGLIKDAPSEQVVESIAAAGMQLEEEIRRSTLLLNKIQEIHAELGGISESFYTCRIKQVPGMYRIQQTNKNHLLQKDGLKRTVQSWMELLPFTFYSFRIENTECIYGAEELDYSWGLALLEEDQQKLEVCLNDSVEYLEPATCISAVIVSTYEEYLERESFGFMLDYAKAQKYTVSGDISGKILFTERTNSCNKTYLEINIPAKQTETEPPAFIL